MAQSRASCKIVIRGSFDVSWAEYVGEMLVHVEVQEGQIRTTTLFGRPIDLAAFLGTLHMLVDLNFPVIAFEYQQADPIEAVDGYRLNRGEAAAELKQERQVSELPLIPKSLQEE